jgi:chromosome segregation ATPase
VTTLDGVIEKRRKVVEYSTKVEQERKLISETAEARQLEMTEQLAKFKKMLEKKEKDLHKQIKHVEERKQRVVEQESKWAKEKLELLESTSSSITTLLTESDPVRFILTLHENEEQVATIKSLPTREHQDLASFPPSSTPLLIKCLQAMQYKEKPQPVNAGVFGFLAYNDNADEDYDEDDDEVEEVGEMMEDDGDLYSEGAGDPASTP